MIQQDLKIRSSSCFLACSPFLDLCSCTPGTVPLEHPRSVLHMNIARPSDEISVRVLILILRIEVVFFNRILVFLVLFVRVVEFMRQVRDGLRKEDKAGSIVSSAEPRTPRASDQRTIIDSPVYVKPRKLACTLLVNGLPVGATPGRLGLMFIPLAL